ncbi:MAG: TldD/PmbA family protein [Candidatus Bathyarchaeota archaeon]|nr:TldD/PmbA family protein [Candidatus Bathyarchaeota archaeon]
MEDMIDLLESLIEEALKSGASYADVRFQEVASSTITVENSLLKNYGKSLLSGLGVRVLVDNALGVASSTILEPKHLREQVENAVKAARTIAKRADPIRLADDTPLKKSVRFPGTKTSDVLSDEEKISLVVDANKSAALKGITNRITRLGWFVERRVFRSSEGAEVSLETTMTGLAHSSVAASSGHMESVSDSRSRCAGFEFILERDWSRFTEEVSRLSLQAVEARSPKPRAYEVVADSDLIGLILHEAFGHASEGDLVATKESVLEGRRGDRIASPQVTLVDEGVVEGGYYLPFDDEGVEKGRQVIVEDGVLKSFLHSRETAFKLGGPSSGNARAQGFGSKPIVRQTNLFMEQGNHSREELVEDIEDGLYICGTGARGGQVNVALGTFTFRVGPSYTITKGEVGEIVRGVSISGTILETLQSVVAVGEDFAIRTSLFGGCGKDGQRVRVGYGGPHVRIKSMMVGGGG